MRAGLRDVFLTCVLVSCVFVTLCCAADPVLQTLETAKAKMSAGQQDFALMEFRAIVDKYPDTAYADEAQFLIAGYYFKRGARFEAEMELKKHLRLFPQSPFRSQTEALLNEFKIEKLLKTGDTYYGEGNWKQAVAVYEQILLMSEREDIRQKADYAKGRIVAEREEAERLAAQMEAEYAQAQAEIAGKGARGHKTVSENKPIIDLESIKVPDGEAIEKQVKEAQNDIMAQLQKHPQTRKLIPTRDELAVWLKYFAIGIAVVLLVLFFYVANCIHVIATKVGLPNSDLAWIPFFNILLVCDIGRRSRWFILLYLLAGIPFAGLLIVTAADIYLWMGVSERRNRSPWLGLLTLVPIGNLVLYGYLAFSDKGGQPTEQDAVVEEERPDEKLMVSKPKSGRF